MAVVRYTNANGRLIAEKRSGVRSFYMADGIGSTRALLDSTQTKTDTFTYWPYGEEKTRTGTTPTPFRYGGALGMYRDATGRLFIRFRNYQSSSGRWMTKDPMLTYSDPYRYGFSNPTTFVDASGLAPTYPKWPSPCPPIGPIECTGETNAKIFVFCNCCYSSLLPDPICALECNRAATAYYRKCKGVPGEGAFQPPPGGGEVAPRRRPRPVSIDEPCFARPMTGCVGNEDDIEDCVGMGWGKVPGKISVVLPVPPFNEKQKLWHLDQCLSCCSSMFQVDASGVPSETPHCQILYSNCVDRCNEYSNGYRCGVGCGIVKRARSK